jgi:hypothetical protein
MTRIIIVVAALLPLGFPVTAEERPTPTETPVPSPSPTPRPAGGRSLAEIAKDTDLKSSDNGKPIVISNENLAEIASQGSVTSVEKGRGNATDRRPVREPGAGTVIETSDAGDSNERRRYWRDQYERQVEIIEALQREIDNLDQEIPGLWRDFYAWDDPAYRDGVIKPKLDAAMDRRKTLEEQLAAARPRLTEIKSDARREGAEPGWFRGLPTPQPALPKETPGIRPN